MKGTHGDQGDMCGPQKHVGIQKTRRCSRTSWSTYHIYMYLICDNYKIAVVEGENENNWEILLYYQPFHGAVIRYHA